MSESNSISDPSSTNESETNKSDTNEKITSELITINGTSYFTKSLYVSRTKEFLITEDSHNFGSKSFPNTNSNSNSNANPTLFSPIESNLLIIKDKPTSKAKRMSTPAIISIIIGCLVVLIAAILIFVFVFIFKRKRTKEDENSHEGNTPLEDITSDAKTDKVTPNTQDIQTEEELDLNFWL